MRKSPERRAAPTGADGWRGWDEYAPFYDWENARTFGRRDIAFWQRLVLDAGGTAPELGCGTGRLVPPLARAGAVMIGIDRSAPMPQRAHQLTCDSRASPSPFRSRRRAATAVCERVVPDGPEDAETWLILARKQ